MSKKLKTLNDLKEEDNELSGCLTPANGEEYNYALGEPFYHTSYKVNYVQLMQAAREWIEYYEDWLEFFKNPQKFMGNKYKAHAHDCDIPVLEGRIKEIKHFFNLED